DMVQSHFGDQALKAAPAFGGSTALPQVFVDNQDALTLPTEDYPLIGKTILPGGGLSMFQNLCGRRLPHIHDRELFQVAWQNLRGIRSTQQSARWRGSRRGSTCLSSLHDAPPRCLEEAEAAVRRFDRVPAAFAGD